MRRSILPPFHAETLTYVNIRVGVQLIAKDYRRNPREYDNNKAARIVRLALTYRLLFPGLYWHMIYIAKLIELGYSLNEIRWLAADSAPRSLHRRRP